MMLDVLKFVGAVFVHVGFIELDCGVVRPRVEGWSVVAGIIPGVGAVAVVIGVGEASVAGAFAGHPTHEP